MSHTERIPFAPGHLVYGGDYNPDQWPAATWEEDAQLMQAAGVNLVSLGIFAWARLEPQPGQYDFAWLDQVLDTLQRYGVRVNLATPTASPPPWLVRLHPTILPVNQDGVRLNHGSRRHYCPNSPDYRRHAAQIARVLATRYREHPTLALWHVDNEYACHLGECFCDQCATAFRSWLQQRYGSLAQLNESWVSAFWGQIYSDWSEIDPPRRSPYMVNTTHVLDWRRFCSDSWLACFAEQHAILRELTPHVPVTTNFMGFHPPVDYWRWARHEDIISNDAYPEPSDPHAHISAAMIHDLMRSLGEGRPWLLMEQVTSHVQWRERNTTKPPDLMRLWSYQAIAHGADGVMFFQWRASRGGAEQFHGAMLPHAGTASRTWREVSGLGQELRNLSAIAGSQVRAEAAIVFDWESWWALSLPGKPSHALNLMQQIGSWYAPLYQRNISVDFVPPDGDFSRYKLLLAPTLFLMSNETARRLEAFVQQGGILGTGLFTGVVDQQAQVHPLGMAEALRHTLGLRVEEWAPAAEGETLSVYTADEDNYSAELWADLLNTEGAEPIAFFGSGFYANRAAATRHVHGAGQAFALATQLDASGSQWWIDTLCNAARLTPTLETPVGVEAVRRTGAHGSFLFLLNHTQNELEVVLPAPAQDLLNPGQPRRTHTIPPRGVVIVGTMDDS